MFLVPRRHWSHQLETGAQWACPMRETHRKCTAAGDITGGREREGYPGLFLSTRQAPVTASHCLVYAGSQLMGNLQGCLSSW